MPSFSPCRHFRTFVCFLPFATCPIFQTFFLQRISCRQSEMYGLLDIFYAIRKKCSRLAATRLESLESL
nr:MAG TPA: hypothetical protein [Bacteriophage sp.]